MLAKVALDNLNFNVKKVDMRVSIILLVRTFVAFIAFVAFLVLYGMVWRGMVWCGIGAVRYGMVRELTGVYLKKAVNLFWVVKLKKHVTRKTTPLTFFVYRVRKKNLH